MARAKTGCLDEANVDLTPMLDVVFILLIFFIVTSTFIQEKAIGMEPPPPKGNGQSDTQGIVLYLDGQNVIRLNGKVVDHAAVRPGLERLRAENPESALIIQAEAEASSGMIIRLRDTAYEADIERVNIVRSE